MKVAKNKLLTVSIYKILACIFILITRGLACFNQGSLKNPSFISVTASILLEDNFRKCEKCGYLYAPDDATVSPQNDSEKKTLSQRGNHLSCLQCVDPQEQTHHTASICIPLLQKNASTFPE